MSDGSPAPWVLPKVWPPAISATVSSSFIAMRKNVSRMSLAAAAGGDAERDGTEPIHADEEAPVMAKDGRPPILRVRHQGVQVLDHGLQVEALEFLGVVERLVHRVGQGGVMVQNLNVQLVR